MMMSTDIILYPKLGNKKYIGKWGYFEPKNLETWQFSL